MKIKLLKSLKKVLGKDVISLFYRSLGFLSDAQFVSLVYRLRLGRKLDLKTPKTFTEKLQYLKVFDHREIYTTMADKAKMKDFVSSRIGEGHTVKTLGVWKQFSDIDFDALPDRFVLKTSHDSGSYVICPDKKALDKKSAEKTLSRSLRRNYYRTTREWQYRNIEPQIIAEEFLEDGKGYLTDYKFFCFNGEPLFMYQEEEASENPTQAILDMDYHLLPFHMEDDAATSIPPRPSCFDEMRQIAEQLSADVPFLRVDMYYVKGVVYVGELTFYHFSGYTPFRPLEWDRKLGDRLDISAVYGDNR